MEQVTGFLQGKAQGSSGEIVGILEQIIGPDLKMFRNALLLKPPQVGSQKGMHQDSPYWPIEPMDLCSCWFALDEATEENGCLGVIPGWHKKGALPHVSVTDDFVVGDGQFDFDDMIMAPVCTAARLRRLAHPPPPPPRVPLRWWCVMRCTIPHGVLYRDRWWCLRTHPRGWRTCSCGCPPATGSMPPPAVC